VNGGLTGAPDASVPRTTRAATTADVVAALSQRRRTPAAVWGMVVLLVSETMLFAAFIATYVFLWSQSDAWPPSGIPDPGVWRQVLPVGCLVLAGVPVEMSWRACRSGRPAAAVSLLGVALVVQCGYLAYQVAAMADDLDRFSPSTNAYGSIYYLLVGADHAHVGVGLLLSLWIGLRLGSGLTTSRANALQAISWYWHGVNALTVIVVVTILAPVW